MIYPYMILVAGPEIVDSHIIKENGAQCVEVRFERPTEDGFDIARCSLSTYIWIKQEG